MIHPPDASPSTQANKYIPGLLRHYIRQLRSWIAHRKALMTQRARLNNQVQGPLGRLLVTSPFKLLWTKKGVAWLHSVELPAHERLMLDSQLRQLVIVQQELKTLDEQLADSIAASAKSIVP
jgi:transposase